MRKIAVLILFMAFFACRDAPRATEAQPSVSEKVAEKIAQAPNVGPAFCGNVSEAALNQIIGNFRDSPQVTFAIQKIPEDLDEIEITYKINDAYQHWSKQIDVPILQVNEDEAPDIVITFDWIDGRGGVLGRADFPGFQKPQILTFDKYDIYSVNGETDYDFFTIALHEAGHTLGLGHLWEEDAVMWPMYQRMRSQLHFHDIHSIKEIYENTATFVDERNRQFVFIDRSDRTKVHPHFTRNEFFTKCRDFHGQGHFIDTALIEAISFIRDFYNQPIQILSSYRPHDCNMRVGGATNSTHLKKKAIDWKFVGPGHELVHQTYQRDIKERTCVLFELLRIGIRGFGGYRTFNHIDTRSTPGIQNWNDNNFAKWGVFDSNAIFSEEDPDLLHLQ